MTRGNVIFFNDTATTEIYTLSLHDALPIFGVRARRAGLHRHQPARRWGSRRHLGPVRQRGQGGCRGDRRGRSEEHTSELQSRQYLACRLLLEKNKTPLILRLSTPTVSHLYS